MYGDKHPDVDEIVFIRAEYTKDECDLFLVQMDENSWLGKIRLNRRDLDKLIDHIRFIQKYYDQFFDKPQVWLPEQ